MDPDVIWIDEDSSDEQGSSSQSTEESVLSGHQTDQAPASDGEEQRNDAYVREFLGSYFAKLKRKRETGESSSDEEEAVKSGSECSSSASVELYPSSRKDERRSLADRMPPDEWDLMPEDHLQSKDQRQPEDQRQSRDQQQSKDHWQSKGQWQSRDHRQPEDHWQSKGQWQSKDQWQPKDHWQPERSSSYSSAAYYKLCRICNRTFDTQARYLQHCKSLVHQRLLNNERTEKDPRVYLCELCNLTCTGLITMESHVAGRRHLEVYEQCKRSGKPVPEHLIPPTLRGASAVSRSSSIVEAMRGQVVDSPLQSIKHRSQWSAQPANESLVERERF